MKKFTIDVDDFLAPGVECVKPVEFKEKKPAAISLQDCLACSGCITSAESILVTTQSMGEFFSRVERCHAEGGIVCVSVGAEVVASFAAEFGVSMETSLKLLSSLMRSVGADEVLEMTAAHHLYRMLCREEFEQHLSGENGNKPLFGSLCPGWVCFAEKSHPEVLPFISKVRSPQQIMGVLVKNVIGARRGVPRDRVYHVSLMMCFDKKLEASRADFAPNGVRDVDTVLTSIELMDLLKDREIDFTSQKEGTLNEELGSFPLNYEPQAADLFRHIARVKYGVEIAEVPFVAGKNVDVKEAVLRIDDRVVLKVSMCNGFRNIQNVIRQFKSKKGCDVNFVETLACPSGCLNGGGQIRSHDNSREASKQKLEEVKEAFGQLNHRELDEHRLRETWRSLDKSLFETQYHAVPPTPGLAVKW